MEEKKVLSFSDLDDEFQFDGVLYFDTAGRSAIPRCVEEEGVKAIQYKTKPWEGKMGGNVTQTNQLRDLYAQLINANGEDIAICPSTAHAMSLAAYNLKRLNILTKESVVVILENQFASSVCPWQAACDEKGAILKVVKDPRGGKEGKEGTWVEELIRVIDEKVVAIVLGNVHWSNGSFIDLPLLSKHLHSLSSPPLLFIDGSQSIGALPFDVQEIKADFIAASVHKWMLAPYGCSLMYLDKKHHETWLPLDHHDRTREGATSPSWDEIGAMMRADGERFPTEYLKGARKIDAGGHPNPIVIPCLIQSLQLLLGLGVENIYQKLRKLVIMINKGVEEKGRGYLRVRGEEGEEGGHYTGIGFTGREEDKHTFNLKVREKLREKKIFISVRCGWLRVSPYAVVTEEEIERFLGALGEVVGEVVSEMGLEK